MTYLILALTGGVCVALLWRLHLAVTKTSIVQANLTAEKISKNEVLAAKSELERKYEVLDLETKAAEKKLGELTNEVKNLTQQLATEEQLKKQQNDSFEAIGNKICVEIAKQAKEDASSGITNIINPFKDSFAQEAQNLKNLVEQTTKSFTDHSSSFGSKAVEATTTAKQATEEVVKLTKMLRGDVQKQGRWGEVQLERVLEASGLIKNIGYELQVTNNSTDEQKKASRADCLFCFPDGKRMVIDAKVSLLHYEKWLGSEKREDRTLAQERFTSSLKNQIDDLASKSYPAVYRDPKVAVLDWVIMFVPNEAALGLAMQDKELWTYATQRKIVFAGPSTLLMIAEAVNQVWKYSRQNESSAQAIKLAEEILGKINGFIAAIKKLGNSLRAAQTNFEQAEKTLFLGRGNLEDKCEKLQNLGLEPRKKRIKNPRDNQLQPPSEDEKQIRVDNNLPLDDK